MEGYDADSSDHGPHVADSFLRLKMRQLLATAICAAVYVDKANEKTQYHTATGGLFSRFALLTCHVVTVLSGPTKSSKLPEVTGAKLRWLLDMESWTALTAVSILSMLPLIWLMSMLSLAAGFTSFRFVV